MNKRAYEFGVDFQQEILQFIVTDIHGYKGVDLIESQYFTLIEHMLIAEAITKYSAKKFITPSLAVIRQEIKQMLRTKAWAEQLDGKEQESVFKILKKIYLKPVKDAEYVYNQILEFARWCATSEALENFPLDNFSAFQAGAATINSAVNKGTSMEEDRGMFFIADAKSRLIRRADSPPGHPTPWWQINALLNNGGTSYGNIITVMGEEKKFKTGFMINTALGYLKRGKVILYVDLENGENSLGLRLDQNASNTDRKGVLDKANDKKLLKKIRIYGRFGGELVIKRFPAGTSIIQIQAYVDKIYRERGLRVNVMFVDYPDIMGDTNNTGAAEETKRIGQVYLDLKNFGDKNEIEAIWCPSHITRDAAKNSKKKRTTDQAKSQDKSRHADMNLSIEQDDVEKEAGIIRIEMVSQRDGPQDGRAYFAADLAKQKIKELNKKQVEEIHALRMQDDDVPVSEETKERNRKRQEDLSDV